jgi:hypothetical protein
VVAHSGIGNVWVFGAQDAGVGPTRAVVAGGADQGSTLALDVKAGIGQVRVVRLAPNSPVPTSVPLAATWSPAPGVPVPAPVVPGRSPVVVPG